MFNKVLFAKLLNKAIDKGTIQEYANKANCERSYISKYVNKRVDYPPKPTKLKDLAQASEGRVAFNELMIAAGHMKSKKELIIHNLNLLQGNMSFEEFSDDILKYYDNNKVYKEVYTPKFLSSVIKGKTELESSHITVLSLYAQVEPSFFDTENTLNDLILAKKNYAQTKQERNRISTICNLYNDKIAYLVTNGVDMSKYISLFEKDNLEYLNKALELLNNNTRV